MLIVSTLLCYAKPSMHPTRPQCPCLLSCGHGVLCWAMRAFDHAATFFFGLHGFGVGGDNSAEFEFARGKQAIQPMNRLGRSSPKTMHIYRSAGFNTAASKARTGRSTSFSRILQNCD